MDRLESALSSTPTESKESTKKIFKPPEATYPYIDSVSNTGTIVIGFDKKMSIEDFTTESLPIIAVTVPGPDSDAKDLLFRSLELIELNQEGKITLKFEFMTPLKISFQDIPDYIMIDLSPGKEDIFIDINGN
eukprot:CAMPEP_0176342868 /NCGR_PEP_ID=MMETSP0126-20121128/3517_1 /TAXON_ID=141414 ORGANISM="Strombidinopsis acuminatum, Strain SPMC142" /NCGR_SAMPLE_ID=MMETSP0126 /ASSEMBLY_ACC=CAM_ASM_000229 /LENGTH=132 /DNA_ID=CAMNT_0017688533 /DNA_START=720 /DNA_END=1118 /DNA_ORIENTATION=+